MVPICVLVKSTYSKLLKIPLNILPEFLGLKLARLIHTNDWHLLNIYPTFVIDEESKWLKSIVFILFTFISLAESKKLSKLVVVFSKQSLTVESAEIVNGSSNPYLA